MMKQDMYKRRVEEVMTKVEWTVEPTDPLSEALGKMKKHGIKEIPVVQKGKLKGLLTFRTLARRRKMSISSHVKSYMITPPAVKPSDKVHKIAEKLITRDFSSLPVTHKTDVMGIVSRKDIIKLIKEDEELRNAQVESVMNFAPTTLHSNMGVKKALTLMDLAGQTSAAVIDGDNKMVGCVTTNELVAFLETPPHRAHKGDFSGEKVSRDRTLDSLCNMPQTVSRTDPVHKVVDLMLKNKESIIYVLDGDELAGSVDEVDLLEVFMKGPSRGGPLIQIAGVEDVKLMEAAELNSLISKYVMKLEKQTSIRAATVRIRHHHHDSDEDKYTVNVKVTGDNGVIAREAYDWDLLVAIGNAFEHVEQQLKKDKNIKRERSRKKI